MLLSVFGMVRRTGVRYPQYRLHVAPFLWGNTLVAYGVKAYCH